MWSRQAVPIFSLCKRVMILLLLPYSLSTPFLLLLVCCVLYFNKAKKLYKTSQAMSKFWRRQRRKARWTAKWKRGCRLVVSNDLDQIKHRSPGNPCTRNCFWDQVTSTKKSTSIREKIQCKAMGKENKKLNGPIPQTLTHTKVVLTEVNSLTEVNGLDSGQPLHECSSRARAQEASHLAQLLPLVPLHMWWPESCYDSVCSTKALIFRSDEDLLFPLTSTDNSGGQYHWKWDTSSLDLCIYIGVLT